MLRARRASLAKASTLSHMSLSHEAFELFAGSREAVIETRSAGRIYPTVVWVVAYENTLYVRSFRGDEGQWYQRALADPHVVLRIGDVSAEFRAVAAADAESIERASKGFAAKYPTGPSLDAMLVPEVLHTTLRLEPVL